MAETSKNTTRNLLLLGGGLLLTLLIVFLVWGDSGKAENWDESYKGTVTHPYGAWVLYELMKHHYPDYELIDVERSLEHTLEKHRPDSVANYFFIGERLILDSADREALAQFVYDGNNALIVSKSLPEELVVTVSPDHCSEWYSYDYFLNEKGVLNLMHDDLVDSSHYEYVFREADDTVSYEWQYFDPWYFCDTLSGFARLGAIDTVGTNFVRFDYGKGKFFFHSTPLAFTNYYMMEDRGLEYATKVLSHLPKANLYWDDVHYSPFSNNDDPNDDSNQGNTLDKNPLSFVLSQPSLAWAWYLLLAGILLFLIFRAKRKQRIIPVLEANDNSSLEFVETIGRLYWIQNNHKKLCMQKWKLFLSFIRSRYHLPTQTIDNKLIAAIVVKSQVDEAAVQQIFDQWARIDKLPDMSAEQLVEFHKSLEHFYINAK